MDTETFTLVVALVLVAVLMLKIAVGTIKLDESDGIVDVVQVLVILGSTGAGLVAAAASAVVTFTALWG